jgi:hypothetical protein
MATGWTSQSAGRDTWVAEDSDLLSPDNDGWDGRPSESNPNSSSDAFQSTPHVFPINWGSFPQLMDNPFKTSIRQGPVYSIPASHIPRSPGDFEQVHLQAMFPQLMDNPFKTENYIAASEKYKCLAYYDPKDIPVVPEEAQAEGTRSYCPPLTGYGFSRSHQAGSDTNYTHGYISSQSYEPGKDMKYSYGHGTQSTTEAERRRIAGIASYPEYAFEEYSSAYYGSDIDTKPMASNYRQSGVAIADRDAHSGGMIESRLENLSLEAAPSSSYKGHSTSTQNKTSYQPQQNNYGSVSHTPLSQDARTSSEESCPASTPGKASSQEGGKEMFKIGREDLLQGGSAICDYDTIPTTMLQLYKIRDLISALKAIYGLIPDGQRFQLNSSEGARVCAGDTTSTTSWHGSSNISLANKSNSTGSRKRRAVNPNDDVNEEKDQNGPGTPGMLLASGSTASKASRLSCPYQKYAPHLFLKGACVGGGFKDIPKVK